MSWKAKKEITKLRKQYDENRYKTECERQPANWESTRKVVPGSPRSFEAKPTFSRNVEPEPNRVLQTTEGITAYQDSRQFGATIPITQPERITSEHNNVMEDNLGTITDPKEIMKTVIEPVIEETTEPEPEPIPEPEPVIEETTTDNKEADELQEKIDELELKLKKKKLEELEAQFSEYDKKFNKKSQKTKTKNSEEDNTKMTL